MHIIALVLIVIAAVMFFLEFVKSPASVTWWAGGLMCLTIAAFLLLV